DSTAGFFAVGRRCVGGTYPGAACTTSAECLGSGTCSFDFGSTLFATTFGSIYTMLKDSAAGSGTSIENCTFWTTQADPYQRCAGGTNAGKPCRQECNAASALPGLACDNNADCSGGACANLADCTTAGGTCSGAPLTATGPGKINVLDFTRTTFL